MPGRVPPRRSIDKDVVTTSDCVSWDKASWNEDASQHKFASAYSRLHIALTTIALVLPLPFLLGSYAWTECQLVSCTVTMLLQTMLFALMTAVFTNLIQHRFFLCLDRDGAHFIQFGPAYTLTIAIVLIMVQPVFLILGLINQVQTPSLMWQCCQHICSVLGYTLLLIVTLWVASVRHDFSGLVACFSCPGTTM